MSDDTKSNVRLEEEDLRQVTLYAATCARKVLSIFETAHPLDPRPREAIAEAEAFGAGKRRTALLRTVAWAAHAAAREIGDGPAAHAAYAASHAAAAAFLHPIASPHQIKHILGSAIHQALALEVGALNAPKDGDATNEHLRWAARLAPVSVRSVLRRYPAPHPGRGRFNELLSELDAELRG